MSNKYYEPGQSRPERVRALFNQIAPTYDLVNDLQSFGLHRLWKNRVIRSAGLQAGQVAVDLCCGTGDLVFRLARAVSRARIIGIDFSESMLAVAQKRQRMGRQSDHGSGSVLLVRADVLKLPVPDCSVDMVTIAYGARNLASVREGLHEASRVLKPGGRMLILDFAEPGWQPWRAVYQVYLRVFVPVFGLLFGGDSQTYSYILESLKHYPKPREITGLLQETGFGQVTCQFFVGGAMTLHDARKGN